MKSKNYRLKIQNFLMFTEILNYFKSLVMKLNFGHYFSFTLHTHIVIYYYIFFNKILK